MPQPNPLDPLLTAPPMPGVVDDVVHDGLQIAGGAAATLAAEPAIFLDRLSCDLANAAGRLAACRSPLEVLAVQQGYMIARGQAWLDSGYRLLERCLAPGCEPETAPPAETEDAFVLPD